MDADSIRLGVTYFRVTYADVGQTMPGVEPVVFVGVDIFGRPDDWDGPKYYFQDAVSVTRFGLGKGLRMHGPSGDDCSDSAVEDGSECSYFAHGSEEIGEVIVDLPALAQEINLAIKRAAGQGFPKLTRAKGPWI